LAPGGGGESSNDTISARLGISAVYGPHSWLMIRAGYLSKMLQEIRGHRPDSRAIRAPDVPASA
jgi:hypothetical protein